MNRRKAIKNVAITFGSVMSLPAWATAWTPEKLPQLRGFSTQNSELLNQLVEALIPKTDTLGAGEMGIEKFVMAMVNDCTPETQRATFRTQLEKVDAFATEQLGKSFSNLSVSEKTDLLRKMNESGASEWKSFFGILKRYTVQGYQSSEYVMNANGFQFAPGFYHGCVDLAQ